MIGYYNYTVWLTYIGLSSGIAGIYLAFAGFPLYAVFCLLFSGFCDLFDGMVARTKKNRTDEERRFGIQLDSLSDLVCFGVLPTAIGCALGLTAWYFVILFCAFVLAGLIRLAYYNVTEETRQKETTDVRRHYLGLPITASAIIFPIAFAIIAFLDFLEFPLLRYLYALCLLVTAFLFVAPIRIAKPHKKGVFVLLLVGVVFTVLLLLKLFL